MTLHPEFLWVRIISQTDWCHYAYIVTVKNNSVFKISLSHDSSRDVIKGWIYLYCSLAILSTKNRCGHVEGCVEERAAQNNLLLTYLPYVFIYLVFLLKNRFFSQGMRHDHSFISLHFSNSSYLPCTQKYSQSISWCGRSFCCHG